MFRLTIGRLSPALSSIVVQHLGLAVVLFFVFVVVEPGPSQNRLDVLAIIFGFVISVLRDVLLTFSMLDADVSCCP